EALTRLSAPTLGFLAGHEDFADEGDQLFGRSAYDVEGHIQTPGRHAFREKHTQGAANFGIGCSGIDFGTDHVGDKEVDIKKIGASDPPTRLPGDWQA
ncbi:MAG TPA: hypothetical protein PLC55_08975, partial [Zoogloea sp.]|nr:hypothetical protein [Zoogloea sp.]